MADVITLANVRANVTTYGWLTPLVVSVDSFTAATLALLENKDPRHDFYQVEDHFEEITRLLDNCLAYRREIYELQSMATKTALEYELFSKHLDSLKELERAKGVRKQLEAQLPHDSAAASAFADDGFKAMARATLAGVNSQIEWEATRTGLVDTKWEMLEQYQRALNERHSEPGNALNYVERFNRVLAFYKEDVEQAYELARATNAGLGLISDVKADFPRVDTNNYLDKLIEWSRLAIKQYNLFRRNDLQCEITIPIRFLPTLKSDYVGQMKEDQPGELIFDLTNYFPPGMKYMRLRGLAVTLNVGTPEAPPARFQQVSAIVVPPPTVDPFGSAPTVRTIPRDPVLVEAAIGDRTIPVKYASSPNLNNIAPDGQWSIIVSKRMTIADDKDRPKRSETRISNIELHLLLATHVQSVATGFQDFHI